MDFANVKKKLPGMITALPVAMGRAASDTAVARIMAGNLIYPLVIRTTFGRGDDRRDAGLTVPEDVARTLDIIYGTDDPQQVMDVYRPLEADASDALPVIISIHGGGYVYGDKERYQYYCMDLARRGFAVVNFSYRLAPKAKYPAQLQDTAACVRYVMSHASELMIDPEKVFFVGDSAGAQMLSQYAAACTNPEYAAQLHLVIPKMRIRAIALNCGLYSFKPSEQLLKCYLPKRLSAYGDELAVTEHITGAYPPTFVMSAYGDFLLENAAPMAHFLQNLGVPCELHIYGDEEHELGHVFHLRIRESEAVACNDDECAYFRKFL